MWRIIKYIWALPATAVGLLFLPLTIFRGGIRISQGALELWSTAIDRLLRDHTLLPRGAMAITLGHVIIGRNETALDRCRAHEQVHVRQYERWGPLFLPAYVLASLWAWLGGGDVYRDNPFEREAFAVAHQTL
jgi:hypothetical protein